VFGAVRDAESRARLIGARVAVSWLELERDRNRPLGTRRVRDILTDSLGDYYACAVARGVELRVQTSAGPFSSGELTVEVGDRRVLRRDLSVSREVLEEAGDSAWDPRRGLATLVGSVRTLGGRAVEAALASVPGAVGDAMTDSAGRFVLTDLPSGSRMLYVRRIGYSFTATPVELRNRDTTGVSLELSPLTILDTLRVTATLLLRAELDDLESRLRGNGFGYVLRPADLRGIYDLRTAFYNLPSLRVQPIRGGYNLLSQPGARVCSVEVWIDGVRQDVQVLQGYQPADVIAVEYYPRGGQAPMRYVPSSFGGCGATLPGVLLVWTRFLR
jgi:hypothetical protein